MKHKIHTYTKVRLILMVVVSVIWIINLTLFKNSVIIKIGQGMVILGVISNLLAVLYNDFKMPMYIEKEKLKIYRMQKSKSVIHKAITKKSQANLFYLCDIISCPIYRNKNYTKHVYFSVGDVLLTIGVIILIFLQ